MSDPNVADITVSILRDIREDIRGMKNEVRGTNERLDALTREVHTTNERIDATNQRLDGTNERLDGTIKRLDGTNERLDTLTHEAAAQIRTIVRYIKDKQGKDIENLRTRVTRLEAKTGG